MTNRESRLVLAKFRNIPVCEMNILGLFSPGYIWGSRDKCCDLASYEFSESFSSTEYHRDADYYRREEHPSDRLFAPFFEQENLSELPIKTTE